MKDCSATNLGLRLATGSPAASDVGRLFSESQGIVGRFPSTQGLDKAEIAPALGQYISVRLTMASPLTHICSLGLHGKPLQVKARSTIRRPQRSRILTRSLFGKKAAKTEQKEGKK